MAIQNRRDFLKNISLLSIGLCSNAPLSTLSGIEADNKDLPQPTQLTSFDTFSCCTTIFCQFDKLKLLELSKELEKLAEEIGCKIFYGEPYSPDIIAIPSFIKIIDRNDFSEKECQDYSAFKWNYSPFVWKDYLYFIEETEINEADLINDYSDFIEATESNIPHLIIDSRDDLELPKSKYVERFNPADTSKIISIVRDNYLQNCNLCGRRKEFIPNYL